MSDQDNNQQQHESKMSRDDSWLRQSGTARDEWDSTSSVSFGEWLRGTRTPEGMDPDEQQLAERLRQHINNTEREAERRMEEHLRGQRRQQPQ